MRFSFNFISTGTGVVRGGYIEVVKRRNKILCVMSSVVNCQHSLSRRCRSKTVFLGRIHGGLSHKQHSHDSLSRLYKMKVSDTF